MGIDGDYKMERVDWGAIFEEYDLNIVFSKKAKEEELVRKNARMFINKQRSHKMRDKPLFPIVRMRSAIRK